MIPKLLVSNNQTEIQKYIGLQIDKFAISPFDLTTLGENGNPIKIEQIRDLKQKLGLKPVEGAKKATIIYAAQNLTSEAQNALLKTLEEPPEDTVILLCAPNENLLLPTIVSRCEIVRIRNSRGLAGAANASYSHGTDSTDTVREKSVKSVPCKSKGLIRENPLIKILRMDTGEKFKLAENLTKKLNKDEVLEDVRKRVEEWLAEIIAELHHHLLAGAASDQNAKNLKTLLAAQKQIRQNLNLRLVLENCFIHLVS